MEDLVIGFQLINPTIEDAEQVLQWRNDPVTLQNSYHSKSQTIEQFWNQFIDKHYSSGIPPLFLLWGHQRVGMVHFSETMHPQKKRRKILEVSINIAPEFRGKGLGVATLECLKPYLKALGVDDLYAEVKQHNTPSIRLFEKAGFTECFRGDKHLRDTDEHVAIIAYLLPLTESNIWDHSPVFIIAEAGSNWRVGSPHRDLQTAKKLIEAAKEAGADAVKFQIYRSKDIYVPNAGKSQYLSEMGIQEDISNLFDDLSMPYAMIPELQAFAAQQEIEFMATSFSSSDFNAVDPYVKRHKIASYELGHIRLLELAAASKKPLLLSTGAATMQEIHWAVDTYYRLGGKNLALLQCTAQYPADEGSMNLSAITNLRKSLKVPVGLSDHSIDPITAPIGAVALGACAIEKHFTLSKHLPGPDHSFALEPHELKQMVDAIRLAEKMVGHGIKSPLEVEEELRKFSRRGVQAIKDISKGEILRENINVAILRPGTQPLGVHPKYLSEIEGKKSLNVIPKGRGIQHEDYSHPN